MKPQNTSKLILKHATALKDLINAYHSTEATTLSKYLNQVIERLQNSFTEANASLDLLKFAIYCAQGNQSTVKNRRIQLAIRDYYHKDMRSEMITELTRVKEQTAKYEDYQNQIFKVVEQLNDKFICVDKLIQKNVELILDLNNFLNSGYLVLITQMARITENNIDYFEKTREDLKKYEFEVLSHNKKIVDLKKQLREHISLMRKEQDFFREITLFHSIADILDNILSFNKGKNCKDVHEVLVLEWLMQNQMIGGNLGQDPNQESNALIKICNTRLKKNFATFFLICDKEIGVESLIVQFEQLQKESEAIVDIIKEVENGEHKITKQLIQLQNSIKAMHLCEFPIETSEATESDLVTNKSSTVFNNAFQFFPAVLDTEVKSLSKHPKKTSYTAARHDNDEYTEDPCFIM